MRHLPSCHTNALDPCHVCKRLFWPGHAFAFVPWFLGWFVELDFPLSDGWLVQLQAWPDSIQRVSTPLLTSGRTWFVPASSGFGFPWNFPLYLWSKPSSFIGVGAKDVRLRLLSGSVRFTSRLFASLAVNYCWAVVSSSFRRFIGEINSVSCILYAEIGWPGID